MRSFGWGAPELVGALQSIQPERLRLSALLAYAGLSASEVVDFDVSWLRDTCTLPGQANQKALTPVQLRALLGEVTLSGTAADELLLYLMAVCGLRQVEVRRLQLSDVTGIGLEGVRVRGKGGGVRRVPIGARGRELLELVGGLVRKKFPNASNAHLFPNRRGGELSRNGVRVRINRFLHQVAPGSTPHALRHTALTMMLNGGHDLKTTMEVAGHSTPEAHSIYVAASDWWFVDAWAHTHPVAGKFGPWSEKPPGSVVIPGIPMRESMRSGVERAVPLPAELIAELREHRTPLGGLLPPWWASTRELTLASETLPLCIRDLKTIGGVHVAENKGHPYLISLIHGTTLEHVLAMDFGRRGPSAIRERLVAVQGCEAIMYG